MNPEDNETPNSKVSAITIIGVNLLVILFVTVLANASPKLQGYNIILLGLQSFICLAIGSLKLQQDEVSEGQSYLFSAFVVLVVGFSSCLGGL